MISFHKLSIIPSRRGAWTELAHHDLRSQKWSMAHTIHLMGASTSIHTPSKQKRLLGTTVWEKCNGLSILRLHVRHHAFPFMAQSPFKHVRWALWLLSGPVYLFYTSVMSRPWFPILIPLRFHQYDSIRHSIISLLLTYIWPMDLHCQEHSCSNGCWLQASANSGLSVHYVIHPFPTFSRAAWGSVLLTHFLKGVWQVAWAEGESAETNQSAVAQS